MTRLKLKALLASLIVSVPAHANEIDNLVNTSQSIRDTFKYGIKAVGGLQAYAPVGGIAPTGTVDQGKISYDQSKAYNDALVAVQNATYTYDPGAQEYLDNQAQTAMNEVNAAVDTYVQAAQAVIEVATVNEMAQDAQAAGDERGAMALQEYIEANDVVLSDAEVDFYNESLDNVESAAQTAAAYFAVAGDAEMVDQANQAAYDMRATYAEIDNSYFDAATGQMSLVFTDFAVTLTLDSYFKLTTEVITEGSNTDFFRTSPEGGCWFAPDYEACLNGTSGS
jgi:polyhydroxyalkanoate synthesis regulator phasin